MSKKWTSQLTLHNNDQHTQILYEKNNMMNFRVICNRHHNIDMYFASIMHGRRYMNDLFSSILQNAVHDPWPTSKAFRHTFLFSSDAVRIPFNHQLCISKEKRRRKRIRSILNEFELPDIIIQQIIEFSCKREIGIIFKHLQNIFWQTYVEKVSVVHTSSQNSTTHRFDGLAAILNIPFINVADISELIIHPDTPDYNIKIYQIKHKKLRPYTFFIRVDSQFVFIHSYSNQTASHSDFSLEFPMRNQMVLHFEQIGVHGCYKWVLKPSCGINFDPQIANDFSSGSKRKYICLF